MSLTDLSPSKTQAPLSGTERFRLLMAAGLVLLFLEFAAPWAGFIGLPISFFLKNKLHLSAQAVAGFNLWASIPLYASFLFGFLRDRWNPFGRGDRGYLIGFGVITAVLFAVLAFTPPTYSALQLGVIAISTGALIAGSAARGVTSALGQDNAVTGQAGVIVNLAGLAPGVFAYGLGGALSQVMEGQSAPLAARILFLTGGALMGAVALFGLWGPAKLLDVHHTEERERHGVLADAGRLLGQWHIYPVLAIYAVWQFGPASGTALQYHLANTLHATDAQVGLWYALFAAGFVPVIAIYGWVCQKVKLSVLLWTGAVVAVGQFVPFLFITSLNEALAAGLLMGILGGVAQAAFTDLAIRACPRGLQGTMMMMLITLYWIPYRFGDLWGTYIYEQQGGFRTAVLATIGVYTLLLPLLMMVPKRFTNTVDGEF